MCLLPCIVVAGAAGIVAAFHDRRCSWVVLRVKCTYGLENFSFVCLQHRLHLRTFAVLLLITPIA
jgi:hypothetical protein